MKQEENISRKEDKEIELKYPEDFINNFYIECQESIYI